MLLVPRDILPQKIYMYFKKHTSYKHKEVAWVLSHLVFE